MMAMITGGQVKFRLISGRGEKARTEGTVDAERRSRNQMPRLELYAERGQQKKGSITRRSQWNAVV
jgi:hypothetical protein